MAPRFWSKEWVDECVEKTKSDKEYVEKTKGKFTASYLILVTDCPDGNDVRVLLKFNKGKVVQYEYEAKPAPASFRMENDTWDEMVSQFRAQASYATYKKLQEKEITPMQALTQNLYKSDGNMVKAMSLMKYSQAFNELQSRTDCVY